MLKKTAETLYKVTAGFFLDKLLEKWYAICTKFNSEILLWYIFQMHGTLFLTG